MNVRIDYKRKHPITKVEFLEQKIIIECTKKKIPNTKFKTHPRKGTRSSREVAIFPMALYNEVYQNISETTINQEREFLSFAVRRC